MTIELLNRSFVGASNATFQRYFDDLVMSFPPPQSIVIDPGTQVREMMTRNNLGMATRAQTIPTGTMPVLNLSFGVMHTELIAFRMNRRMAAGTFATHWPYQLRVTKGTYAAKTTGYLGFAITADAEADGSVIRNGISTPLVQADFADHATWKTTDDQFALGAAGALAFSDNLVANNDMVTLLLPETLAGNRISGLPGGAMKFSCTLVDTLGTVSQLTVHSCEPNPAAAAIDFSAESTELNMNVNALPGTCDFFEIIDTTLKVTCI
jgi:hypothetical protein